MFFVAEVPSIVIDQLGRTRHIPVRGIIDGTSFKSTCVPRKDKRVVLILNGEIRKKIGKADGDAVHVQIEYDPDDRNIPLPEDMELILAEDEEVLNEFISSSPSNRREYIKYVLQAKHEDTRLKRINLLVIRLRERIANRKSKQTDE